MSLEQDLIGAANLTETLRAAAAALESLERSREEIARILRCSKSRPPWWSGAPLLEYEEDLARRLDSLAHFIDGARKRLIDQREELRRVVQLNSPFVCPSELNDRIDYFDLLCKYARRNGLQDFLRVYKRAPSENCISPELIATAQRISNILQGDLEKEAREYADRSGEIRGWPRWQTYRDMYLKDHVDKERQTLIHLLQHLLAEARSECQLQKEWHAASLERYIEDQLTTYVADLRDAVTQAGYIVTEVQAVRSRETTAVEAVQKVWQGTQAANRYVERSRVPLGEVDRLLARDWASDYRGDSYSISAMMSARCAELVALEIYREIYGTVEDLSILQIVAPRDTRWKTADIVACARWIDVKNARRSFSSPNSYSEHCVKRFKANQGNRQVIISGFLSPYLTDNGRGEEEPVIWLGETSLKAIESLRSHFETDYLQLDFSGSWATRIPPWLFEYPTECYAERDAAIAAARSPGFILPRRDLPIGMLVLIGRVGRPSPEDPLSEEAVALAPRIGAESMPTRPMLFLHVLDRFCIATRAGLPFPAEALRRILFSPDSPVLAEYSDDTTPLAVLDPLNTVKELLDVLEKVAETCAARAVVFASFRLVGSGVFQGRQGGGSWQTIFAYCGGWRKLGNGGKAKCGQNPLFLGQNEPCGECGKLVCHECGYCSERCPLCSPRQAGWAAP